LWKQIEPLLPAPTKGAKRGDRRFRIARSLLGTTYAANQRNWIEMFSPFTLGTLRRV
jgi:hypothetical protein